MGYGEAPWVFKGRALYQLQLVKSEDARKHVPENFKLVEMFGYTLGGFYLARYDDSPVGAFEELVALAGLVWNAPTSCAWAARVYVNNREARDHGLKSVGLPSRLARFAMVPSTGTTGAGHGNTPSWWDQLSAQRPSATTTGLSQLCISNVDGGRGRSLQLPVCTLQLPAARPLNAWPGPRINLTLPSFSGGTPDFPALLQYSCDLMTNVRPVAPAAVTVPEEEATASGRGNGSELMTAVLGGLPVVALAFDDMVMTVEEPIRLKVVDPAAAAPAKKRGLLLGVVPPAAGASSS